MLARKAHTASALLREVDTSPEVLGPHGLGQLLMPADHVLYLSQRSHLGSQSFCFIPVYWEFNPGPQTHMCVSKENMEPQLLQKGKQVK